MGSDEHWQRVNELFHSTLALPPADRRAFLDSACGGDAALREEVLSLVLADSGSASRSHERWPRLAAAAWADATPSSGPHASAPAGDGSIAVGTTVAHYDVVGRLGAGGMGEVYLARDRKLGRLVALKTLPRALADHPRRLERFELEARAASALNHPGVAAIYELGEYDGLHVIVMEYIEGRPLADLVREGPLPIDRAITIALQIARALTAAHRLGITHRDIKPANVMVTAAGDVKVLDFGLAKVTAAGLVDPEQDGARVPFDLPADTQPGLIVGTIHYMSPEQALGEPIDHRTDLFSLGVVLYQLLTGRVPFEGRSSTAAIDALLHREPVPASAIRTGVAPDVDQVLACALAKPADARYQTAEALAGDLEALLRRDTPAVATQAWPRPFRRPRRLLPVALVMAVAILGTGFAIVWARGATAAAAPVVVPVTSFVGTETTPAFAPDGQTIAYAWDGPTGDNFDIYLQPIGGTPARLTSGPAAETHPAFSPDGRTVAFIRNRSRLIVIPRQGGAERDLGSVGDPRVTFTPDGASVAATAPTGAGLVVIPLDGGPRRPLTAPPPGSVDISPAFSRDGRSLAFQRIPTATVSDIWVADADGGNARRVTFDDRSLEGPVWTTDSRSLVFSSARRGAGRIWRVSSTGGTPEPLPDTGPGSTMPTIARTGGRVAFVASLEDTNIWELHLDANGQPVSSPARTASASTWLDGSPDISPDGTRLAFSSNRSGRDEIWVADLDGASARAITNFADVPASAVGSPRWSPDGTRVAFDARVLGNADIYVAALDGRSRLRRLTTNPSADVVPTWSRDGRLIYFTSQRNGGADVWRMPSNGGPEVRVTDGGGFGAQESLDGAFLLYTKERTDSMLWRRPVSGGPETRALVDASGAPHRIAQFASWRPTARGTIFLEQVRPAGARGPRQFALRAFDATTRRVTTLFALGAPPAMANGGIALAPDGRRLLFSQLDAYRSDIVLLQPFR